MNVNACMPNLSTSASPSPSWQGHLTLRYRREPDGRCVAHDLHDGPLRVLKALYPEGPSVCHHVLVHPPGGVVGGDVLGVEIDVGPHAHALITTPGATRFYRSTGAIATQSVRVRVREGARFEWLPMTSIAYDGCLAENRVSFELETGAQMIGMDLVVLGLPAANLPFMSGRYVQHLEWPGRWLERGTVDASDARLLQSALGLGGHTVMATLWCASGGTFDAQHRNKLLDAARDGACATEGSTAPGTELVVWRALGSSVEQIWARAIQVRAQWRHLCWDLPEMPPRVWST